MIRNYPARRLPVEHCIGKGSGAERFRGHHRGRDDRLPGHRHGAGPGVRQLIADKAKIQESQSGFPHYEGSRLFDVVFIFILTDVRKYSLEINKHIVECQY